MAIVQTMTDLFHNNPTIVLNPKIPRVPTVIFWPRNPVFFAFGKLSQMYMRHVLVGDYRFVMMILVYEKIMSWNSYIINTCFYKWIWIKGIYTKELINISLILISMCWGLALKCYELRTRQHKMLNDTVLRPWSIIPLRIMGLGRRLIRILLRS